MDVPIEEPFVVETVFLLPVCLQIRNLAPVDDAAFPS